MFRCATWNTSSVASVSNITIGATSGQDSHLSVTICAIPGYRYTPMIGDQSAHELKLSKPQAYFDLPARHSIVSAASATKGQTGDKLRRLAFPLSSLLGRGPNWSVDPAGTHVSNSNGKVDQRCCQIENAGGEAKASGLLKHWQLVLYGTEESPLPTSEKPQHTSSPTPSKEGDRYFDRESQ